jgi:hypothetical protein
MKLPSGEILPTVLRNSSRSVSISLRDLASPVKGTVMRYPPASQTSHLPSGEISLGPRNAPGVYWKTNSSPPLPSESLR